ncbi:MAG: hypothetical protein OXQ32_08185 [bacterium]|nr:hypothetical protein [bacterium]
MESINSLVALFVLTATLSLVPVLYLYYVVKGRPRPLRSAVHKTQEIVARWAVWLVLALATLYGLEVMIDRWGLLLVIATMCGFPAAFGVVALAMLGWRKRFRPGGTGHG